MCTQFGDAVHGCGCIPPLLLPQHLPSAPLLYSILQWVYLQEENRALQSSQSDLQACIAVLEAALEAEVQAHEATCLLLHQMQEQGLEKGTMRTAQYEECVDDVPVEERAVDEGIAEEVPVNEALEDQGAVDEAATAEIPVDETPTLQVLADAAMKCLCTVCGWGAIFITTPNWTVAQRCWTTLQRDGWARQKSKEMFVYLKFVVVQDFVVF